MATEKKKTTPTKPTIHNHYGADTHLLNVLLWALMTVVAYFAFVALLSSPVVVSEKPVKQEVVKVRILGPGRAASEVTVPRVAPEPRIQNH